MSKSGKKGLGYWEITAIGVGGMVGGGIFAVLGLAVELTSGGRSTRSFFNCRYRCPRYLLFLCTTLCHISESGGTAKHTKKKNLGKAFGRPVDYIRINPVNRQSG